MVSLNIPLLCIELIANNSTELHLLHCTKYPWHIVIQWTAYHLALFCNLLWATQSHSFPLNVHRSRSTRSNHWAQSSVHERLMASNCSYPLPFPSLLFVLCVLTHTINLQPPKCISLSGLFLHFQVLMEPLTIWPKSTDGLEEEVFYEPPLTITGLPECFMSRPHLLCWAALFGVDAAGASDGHYPLKCHLMQFQSWISQRKLCIISMTGQSPLVSRKAWKTTIRWALPPYQNISHIIM